MQKLIPHLVIVIIGLAISAYSPKDMFTWFLEVVPILIAWPLLLLIYNKWRFTKITYGLIVIHSIILMIGAHYTYAEVPLFDWIADTFGLERNYYDRVGHFVQGFVPAIIARELLIRKKVVLDKSWLFFLVLTCCLFISVFYEFFEWWVAVATGESAEAFLGTQGDVWDTQWDMFMAFVGALVAQILLRRSLSREIHLIG